MNDLESIVIVYDSCSLNFIKCLPVSGIQLNKWIIE